MALNREYTPARRMAMTVVMWGILAATVGLAVLSSRYPVEPRVRNLDPEQLERLQRQQVPRLTP
jgi:hypothetical protein